MAQALAPTIREYVTAMLEMTASERPDLLALYLEEAPPRLVDALAREPASLEAALASAIVKLNVELNRLAHGREVASVYGAIDLPRLRLLLAFAEARGADLDALEKQDGSGHTVLMLDFYAPNSRRNAGNLPACAPGCAFRAGSGALFLMKRKAGNGPDLLLRMPELLMGLGAPATVSAVGEEVGIECVACRRSR